MGRHRNVVPYVDATPRHAWDRGMPAHRAEDYVAATMTATISDLAPLIKQAKRSVQLLAADRDPAALQVLRVLDDMRREQAARKARARA
jgi:hypothetical protein